MINIICDDNFFKKKLLHLFDQQNFFLSLHKTDQYFFEIIIFKKENCLEISIKDEKINLNLPKSFNEIHDKIYRIISNISIILQKHEYFPLKQLIKNNEKNILLTDIQNTIMSNLLLNSDRGINKVDLIKTIWPNDKVIFFNKLDTHLTNLKNNLSEEIGYDLKFSSKSGIIKLVIN